MTDKDIFIAGIFLIWGGIGIVRPQIILKLRSWMSEKFFGAEYKPSHKTENIQRVIGLVFIFLAMMIMGLI